MILRYTYLRSHAAIFKAMTGLHVFEFDTLLDHVQPQLVTKQYTQRNRPARKRAIGAGPASG